MTEPAQRAAAVAAVGRSPKPSLARGLSWALYALSALLLVRFLSGGRSGPAVHRPAPEFSLALLGEATRFSLSAERGHPVLIDVMASWCGACRASAPALAEASRASRSREVRFVAVSMDQTAAAAEQARRSWHIPYPVALDDGSFSRDFAVTMLPTIIVIDDQGRVAHVATGAARAAEIEDWLGEVGAPRR